MVDCVEPHVPDWERAFVRNIKALVTRPGSFPQRASAYVATAVVSRFAEDAIAPVNVAPLERQYAPVKSTVALDRSDLAIAAVSSPSRSTVASKFKMMAWT